MFISHDPCYDLLVSWNEINYFADKTVDEPYHCNEIIQLFGCNSVFHTQPLLLLKCRLFFKTRDRLVDTSGQLWKFNRRDCRKKMVFQMIEHVVRNQVFPFLPLGPGDI